MTIYAICCTPGCPKQAVSVCLVYLPGFEKEVMGACCKECSTHGFILTKEEILIHEILEDIPHFADVIGTL